MQWLHTYVSDKVLSLPDDIRTNRDVFNMGEICDPVQASGYLHTYIHEIELEAHIPIQPSISRFLVVMVTPPFIWTGQKVGGFRVAGRPSSSK